MSEVPSEIITWLNAISPFATVIVTLALVGFTWVLAKETRRMADAGAQPQVVVTLEPNDWAINHVDMKIANTGNATAFDIKVGLEPPPKASETGPKRPLPFQHMSVLRPGQLFSSHISDHASLKDQIFTITVTWAKRPSGKRESLTYQFSLSDYQGLARLGGGDPMVQISQNLKALREDWRYVASGSRRIGISTFDQSDRDRERAELEAMYEQDFTGNESSPAEEQPRKPRRPRIRPAAK